MDPSPSEITPLLEWPASSAFLSVFQQEAKTLLKPCLRFVCMFNFCFSTYIFAQANGKHAFIHSIVMSSVTSIEHISTIALSATTIGFMHINITGLSIIQGMLSALDTRARGLQISYNSLNEQRCLLLQTVVLQILILIKSNAS